MKREALRHPKMLDLAARLRLPREYAIGIVNVLIDWVHDMAPRGDVGKWPNGAIAVACGQSGDPDEFISALTESRWLDSHPRHRLLVHDYPDHAERFVKAKLVKDRQWFCSAYYTNGRVWDAPRGILPPVEESFPILPAPPVEPPIRPPAVLTTVATVPCDQTKPNQTKPNHPQTPAENSAAVAGLVVAGGWDVWTEDSEARARLALKGCEYKRYNDLIVECRQNGLLPKDIITACEEYQANKPRFESPGAIAEKLRGGFWPAEGIVSPEAAAKAKQASKLRDREMLVTTARLRLRDSGCTGWRDWDDQKQLDEAKARGLI